MRKLILTAVLILLLASTLHADVDGFMGAEFGMSEEEVNGIFDSDTIEVGGEEYLLELNYHEDQLYMIMLVKRFNFKAGVETVTKDLESVLNEKYGEPDYKSEIDEDPPFIRGWLGEYTRADIQVAEDLGMYYLALRLMDEELREKEVQKRSEELQDAF